jgi:hypothetical protein
MALTLDGTTGISASGNITGGNIIVSGSLTAGSFSPASLSTAGNITGGNILGGANVNAVTHTGTTVSVTGNVTGGNLSTVGNVTGAFLFGNASTVTGLSASKIFNGTTEANVGTSGGNANISVGGTSNVAVFATTGVFVTGVMSATGNVSGGNLIVTGNLVDTGALSIITSSNGNITLAPNGTGVVVVNTDIRNGQATGVGNIGTTGAVFNTVFARATSAVYADVAEKYLADEDYPVGTVLAIGGVNEVTACKNYHGSDIIGTVSDKPAYVMNSELEGEAVVTVALLGRVPVRVIGSINRGDLLAASEHHGIATALKSDFYQPGCVIGKALESYNSETPGVIEAIVGRI